jgi:hypothetical protein
VRAILLASESCCAGVAALAPVPCSQLVEPRLIGPEAPWVTGFVFRGRCQVANRWTLMAENGSSGGYAAVATSTRSRHVRNAGIASRAMLVGSKAMTAEN